MMSRRLVRSLAFGLPVGGFALGALALLAQFAAAKEAAQSVNRQAMLIAQSATYSEDPDVAVTGCRIFHTLARDDPFDAPQMVQYIEDRCHSKM